jgi:hypothetical protein
MKTNYLKKLTLISFLTLLLIPSLLYYTFFSLSHGVIIFSILLASYTLIFQNSFFTATHLNLFLKTYFIVLVVILLHFLVSTLFATNVNNIRFFLSFLAFAVFLLASAIFSSLLVKIYKANFFDNIFKAMFYIVLFLAFLGVLRYSTYSPVYNNDYILLTVFAEPSHLVMTLLPFFYYFILNAKNLKSKLQLIFLFVAISVLIKSATLMIAILLFLLIFFSYRQLFNLLLILTLIYFIFDFTGLKENLQPFIDFEYFYQRFSLNPYGDKVNISVLVFLAGYHEIYLNLKNTFFLGIGFQQYGFVGEQSFLRDLIYVYSGTFEYSANKDSSFLFGKYISEFGIFGIVTILYYFKYFLKNLIYIKKNVSKNNDLNLFFSACAISFFVELFVRGAGYFTVSSFLFMASIFGQRILTYYDKKN